MSLETLDRTGLIQPGAVPLDLPAKLPEPRGDDKTALNTTRFTIEAKFPESGLPSTTGPIQRHRSGARGGALH